MKNSVSGKNAAYSCTMDPEVCCYKLQMKNTLGNYSLFQASNSVFFPIILRLILRFTKVLIFIFMIH